MIMRLTKIILTFGLLVTTALLAEAQTPRCKVGKDAAAIGFWSWRANTKVSVYVVARQFPSFNVDGLFTPFRNWNKVSQATGSGVVFEFAGVVAEQQLCDNCLTLMRGDVFDRKRRHATELSVYSATSNQLITYAAIVVDDALTNEQAVLDSVAHEIGHSFSLLDCHKCKARSTVMNQFRNFDAANNITSATQCDVEQVRKAYEQLAVSIGPAPSASTIHDEGEEPEEDDTPVILPRP